MARRVDLTRRAEIGAEKRNRTRVTLLGAARELFGDEAGRGTRIEDVCEKASIARGTFYNYFTSIDALQTALFEHLSQDFDDAVHSVFAQFESASERTSAAIRYYLGRSVRDPHWGWGMVNTGMGTGLIANDVTGRVLETIQEGIDTGEFTISLAVAGRDMVLGSGLAAAITLLKGAAPHGYIEMIAARLLMALGVSEEHAKEVSHAPLPPLPITIAAAAGG